MKICFRGTSHAALTLKEGARRRGFKITDNSEEADLIFISQDTPTDINGYRNTSLIREMVEKEGVTNVPIIITSQVTPGFCRSLPFEVYHQAETLRIEDGLQRAMFPEMFIVGTNYSNSAIQSKYVNFMQAFACPIIQMDYESAEFAKIAINAFLISQVETSNMLAERAELVEADWNAICQALRHDSRIGKYAYLTPGDPLKSKHLLRDFVTLKEILPGKLLEAWE